MFARDISVYELVLLTTHYGLLLKHSKAKGSCSVIIACLYHFAPSKLVEYGDVYLWLNTHQPLFSHNTIIQSLKCGLVIISDCSPQMETDVTKKHLILWITWIDNSRLDELFIVVFVILLPFQVIAACFVFQNICLGAGDVMAPKGKPEEDQGRVIFVTMSHHRSLLSVARNHQVTFLLSTPTLLSVDTRGDV